MTDTGTLFSVSFQSILLLSSSLGPSPDPDLLLRLEAFGHSCFSVSMSVNWTACPPPLVRNTSPLMSLVSISPSEASSWCLSTYLWHFDSAFSLGADTLIALGMIGCITVPKSKFEGGLWSTVLSPPAEWERLWWARIGVAVWCPQLHREESTNQEIIHMVEAAKEELRD